MTIKPGDEELSKNIENNEEVLMISDFEKKYSNCKINLQSFLQILQQNGSSLNSFRYYIRNNCDFESLCTVYEDEDPRLLDYPPDEKDTLNEEARYLSLPYPDLSLFADIKTNDEGISHITELRICKVYATGCFTAGTHSDFLLEGEASLVEEILSRFVNE